jgi:hypothetical protein
MGQGGDLRRAQRGDHLLGAGADGAFQPAHRVEGGVAQFAFGAALAVQLLQAVLQQRQAVGAGQRGPAQHLIQPSPCSSTV